MTAPQLVLWGTGPEGHYRHGPRVALKITAGTLAHVRHEAAQREAQGWSGLLACRRGCHPDDVATCGTCGRSWDAERYPTPSNLCPFCNGDGRAAARWRAYRLGSTP